MPTVSSARIRGARALLDRTMTDLATAARVSISTVKRVENGGMASVASKTVMTICHALEQGGVLFLPDDGSGAGLRLRTPVVARPVRAIA